MRKCKEALTAISGTLLNTINVHDYHEAYNHGRLSRKEKVYWCPASLEKATHRSLPIVSS